VEGLVVDAVDDPVQLVRLRSEELIEPFAEFGRLDLRRVPLADRVHDVGEMNSAPKHVDHVVEAGYADVNQAPLVEARERKSAEPEHALSREVVDREHGR